MIKLITTRRIYFLIGLAALLLILLFFGNLSINKSNPGGFDFFTHWYATRIYIKDGVNPYSEIAETRITDMMSEQLEPGESDVFRFAVPLFSIVFLTPFSLVGEFRIASALWTTFSQLILILTSWLFLNLVTTNKKLLVNVILTLLMLFSLPSVSAFLSGSLTIVSFALFAFSAMCMILKKDEAAGLLLAFSLVKADLFFPGVLLILIWAAFRGRMRIFWWFLGTFTLIMGFSILLIPDWVLSYLQVITSYTGINPMQVVPPNDSTMTLRLNLVKILAVIALLFFEWIVVRIQGKRKLAWNIALLLLLLPWFGRSMNIEQTILYLPSLTIALGLFFDQWQHKAYNSILLLPILLFILSWIFSGFFLTGISIVLSKIILFVVQPAIILIFLYWVRWWVLRSEKFSHPIINN